MAPGVVALPRRPANHAVEEFMVAKRLDQHQRNLSNKRTTINNSWTSREETRLQASRHNIKRTQQDEDRFTGIERENVRLMMKMQDIERRPQFLRGKVNQVAAQMMLGGGARSSSVPAGSNVRSRSKVSRAIDAENARMLKRLQDAKGSVNFKEKERKHQAQQEVMRMRCEHEKRDWRQQRAQRASSLRNDREAKMMSRLGIDPNKPYDPDCQELLDFKEQLQQKLSNMEEPEAWQVDAVHRPQLQDTLSPGQSPARSQRSSQASPNNRRALAEFDDDERRSTLASPAESPSRIGGAISKHSKNLVAQLMREADEADEEAAIAKAAAQQALQVAQAVEAPVLHAFENPEPRVEDLIGARLQRLQARKDESDSLEYNSLVQRAEAILDADDFGADDSGEESS